jgi:thymidylate synthase ThyX
LIEAKVIADSYYVYKGKQQRITTLQLRYHRYIHGEFMTHRVFSRNASSSRAIPVKTVLKQVWNAPAIPVHWGANQSGMQAKAQLEGGKLKMAGRLWKLAGKAACAFAWGMMKVGLHKQVANRILEPWQYISVIVTATEWDNFFALRNHPDAQPEIQELAQKIGVAMTNSTPKLLRKGEWHLPYVLDEEIQEFGATVDAPNLKKASAARCARVSYLTHDGKTPDIQKDIGLHDRLVGSNPIHASPVEHQATPAGDNKFHKNFRGWIQYREEVENQQLNAR